MAGRLGGGQGGLGLGVLDPLCPDWGLRGKVNKLAAPPFPGLWNAGDMPLCHRVAVSATSQVNSPPPKAGPCWVNPRFHVWAHPVSWKAWVKKRVAWRGGMPSALLRVGTFLSLVLPSTLRNHFLPLFPNPRSAEDPFTSPGWLKRQESSSSNSNTTPSRVIPWYVRPTLIPTF